MASYFIQNQVKKANAERKQRAVELAMKAQNNQYEQLTVTIFSAFVTVLAAIVLAAIRRM